MCNLIADSKHRLILITFQHNANLLFSMIQPIFYHILDNTAESLPVSMYIQLFFRNLNIRLNFHSYPFIIV